MLESTKDQILGVDIPGQHVSQRVRYVAACLLIRNTIGCVLLRVVGLRMVIHPAHMVQEGPVGETLALQAGPVGETIEKHDILM
jgi:hypothetical protein